MASVAVKVMSIVSAPYGVRLTAAQLAERIADLQSAEARDCSVFAFLSEVSPKLQRAFITEMAVDPEAVGHVARRFSDLAGFPMALAR